MSLMSKERQVAETLGKIRADHTARYYWAKGKLKHGDVVLDAMCGIGYGSYIMAISLIPEIVVAFDCDEETIQYANKHYGHPKIEFHNWYYDEMQFELNTFDKIVCFEGIEHIDEPKKLLKLFHRCLKDDGMLLLSTPNGNKMARCPIKHPEHKFHYKPEELERDLDECGFKVEQFLSQRNKFSLTMDENLEGIFMLCVGRKK